MTIWWLTLLGLCLNLNLGLALQVPQHNCERYFSYYKESDGAYIGVFTAPRAGVNSLDWEVVFNAHGTGQVSVCWVVFSIAYVVNLICRQQLSDLSSHIRLRTAPSKRYAMENVARYLCASKTSGTSCPNLSGRNSMMSFCAETMNVSYCHIRFFMSL